MQIVKSLLENRYALTGIVGSNPTASAKWFNGLVRFPKVFQAEMLACVSFGVASFEETSIPPARFEWPVVVAEVSQSRNCWGITPPK